MNRRWAAVAVATAALGLPTPARASEPPPTPFSLTAVVAEAGWFEAAGTCPRRTYKMAYTWTNASNGIGSGELSMKPGEFRVGLRMLASGPGESIDVTITCHTGSRRRNVVFGPVSVVSGVDLLPAPPDGSGDGRRIVYSLSAQQLWAVEADGTVAHTHLVSGRRLGIAGGRKQTGVFRVYAKRRAGCSGACINFLNFHRTLRGIIGFHEIPRTRRGPAQQESELGQPRSHGCVRQRATDAAWLFEWAQLGDPVIVTP